MIQDLMRKHKTAFLWVILLLVIVPFVFWGGNFGGNKRGAEERKLETIAVVEGIQIPQQYFRSALEQQLQRVRQVRPDVTMEDLHEDGTAMDVLEGVVNQTLLDVDAERMNLTFDKDFLIEQLKQSPRFQRDGEFDREYWNTWVSSNKDINWNEEYANISSTLERQLLLQRIVASARVLPSEVKEAFEAEHTEMVVRYVSLEAPVELTDEDVRAYYDENLDAYQTPRKLKARFVAVSIKAPKPAIADEIVQRARSGEDFAALATEYTEGPFKDKAGEMGWRADEPSIGEPLKSVFAMQVGEVSEPLEGGGGYYIYKVEDERTQEGTGQREVFIRQIFLKPQLSEEEMQARREKAEAISAKAKESGSIDEAAQSAGLAVQVPPEFSEQAFEIQGVAPVDVWPFRSAVTALEDNAFSDVITGRENLYVAQVFDIVASEQKPFDEVKAQAREDAVRAKKRSPEYREETHELAESIAEEANSIADIIREHPELKLEPKTSEPFTPAGFQPDMNGPLWSARQVYEEVGRGAPGAFGGPIMGYRGEAYFVELVRKTPPGEDVYAEKWEEEKADLHRRLLARAQQDRLRDYFLERRPPKSAWLVEKTYDDVVGLNQEEEPAEAAAGTTEESVDAESDSSQAAAEASGAEPVVGETPSEDKAASAATE